jgi:hypothetical protein
MATSRNPLPHDQTANDRLLAARGYNPLARSQRYFLPPLRLVDSVPVVLGPRFAVDLPPNRPVIALLTRLTRLPPLFLFAISSASLSPLRPGVMLQRCPRGRALKLPPYNRSRASETLLVSAAYGYCALGWPSSPEAVVREPVAGQLGGIRHGVGRVRRE